MTTRRYFFVIQWPDNQHDDPTGTTFSSDSAAGNYAMRVIRELKFGGGYDDPGLTMVVKDDSGRIVFSVPFSTVP
jgi:hypothetical protein